MNSSNGTLHSYTTLSRPTLTCNDLSQSNLEGKGFLARVFGAAIHMV